MTNDELSVVRHFWFELQKNLKTPQGKLHAAAFLHEFMSCWPWGLTSLGIIDTVREKQEKAQFAWAIAKFLINEFKVKMDSAEESIQEVKEYRPWLQEDIAYLFFLRQHGVLTAKQVRDVFEECWEGVAAFDVICRDGFFGEGGDALADAVDKVIAGNAKAVADFKNGKQAALNSLVGQVMKELKGKADANEVRISLTAKLTT